MIIGASAFGFGVNVDTTNNKQLNAADNDEQYKEAQLQASVNAAAANAAAGIEQQKADTFKLMGLGGLLLGALFIVFKMVW